jgi:hypothetical protein
VLMARHYSHLRSSNYGILKQLSDLSFSSFLYACICHDSAG